MKAKKAEKAMKAMEKSVKCKKIAALAMCAPLFFGAAACGGNNNNNGNAPEAKQPVYEALVNSFESYADAYDFDYSGKFILSVNKNAEYVTDGAASLYFTVDETRAGKSVEGTFNVPAYRMDGSKDYRDFSKVSRVTYDVFNAGEKEISINTCLLSKKQGYLYSNAQTEIIAPGEKKEVTYKVNPYSLYYALGIDQITHISVNVLGTDPQVYFDNLRLRYVSREFVAPETETGGNSLLNFEKGYHSFVTYVTGTNYAAEVVNDSALAIEGNRCVRVYRKDKKDGEVLWTGGKFGISANYLSAFNLSSVPEGSYVSFDVKLGWVGAPMWVVPRLVSATGGGYINIHNMSFPADGLWHTVCVPADIAPALFDNIEISFDGGSYGDIYFDDFRMLTEVPEGAIVATKWGLT